jgi:hypothetical protein
MSSLKSLLSAIQPPDKPTETPDEGGWKSVEVKLRLKLPMDYQEFIASYGTGAIDNFLWVLNPFSRNNNLNLITQAKIQLDAQRQFSMESGITAPYAFYPETNGLFPWGITDNGDVLYWLCKGSPSDWETVACDSRASRWRAFHLTMSEFLTELVTRKLIVDIFPEDFPSEKAEFISA